MMMSALCERLGVTVEPLDSSWLDELVDAFLQDKS
jgi:hypothetical protein